MCVAKWAESGLLLGAFLPIQKQSQPCSRAPVPRGGAKVQLYSFLNLIAKQGWVFNAMTRPLNPKQGNRYSFYRRLGWPRDRSGRVQIISFPSRFEPLSSPQLSSYADQAFLYYRRLCVCQFHRVQQQLRALLAGLPSSQIRSNVPSTLQGTDARCFPERLFFMGKKVHKLLSQQIVCCRFNNYSGTHENLLPEFQWNSASSQ